MYKSKADIIFIQETHFKTESIPKLSNFHYPTVFRATNTISKMKGVSILFVRNSPFQVSDYYSDKEGRYLFVKGTLNGKSTTLANIYTPNTNQVSFFCSITQVLSAFQEGFLILGGDFNAPLNLTLDTSSGT